MNKYFNADIKPFSFNDLKGDHVVSQNKEFKAFTFGELDVSEDQKRLPEDVVRKERGYEKKTNFRMDEKVRQLRGLAGQEQTDLERQIAEEVERRVAAVYESAYQEGVDKGRQEGKEESLQEYQAALSEKVEDFANQLDQVREQTQSIYAKNKNEMNEFIKRFTKWILMKEINDKVYLENLLEKLILELNARKNLIVKVGRENFSQMPDVIKHVESRLGQLQNVRVEIVPQLAHPGIILETDNALIDGSLEGVFANIDKIFEQVMNHGS